VFVETRSCHEFAVVWDCDRGEHALTPEKKLLWVVDRAFIGAGFRDAKKRRLASNMITRWKDSLVVERASAQAIACDPVNREVARDEQIALCGSR
jgi:hypothetical protein